MSDIQRYSRQIQLAAIGESGQQVLSNSSVLIVGVGGLGCTVSAQLAGAGVGKITIVDYDQVELSNLHRQILFREHHIGESKANITATELKNINSDIEIIALNKRFSPDNAESLIADHDLIIDAADSMIVSYLLSDACDQQNLPLLSASVNQSYGVIGTFCGVDNPSYREVFPHFPEQINTCQTTGVTGPSVGIIANIQAQEAIKILLNSEHQLKQQLLYFDLWQYQIHRIKFEPSSDHQKIELVTLNQLEADDVVIDVREANEVEPDNRNLNIPLSVLKNRLDELPQNQRIACLCKSGHRAMLAAQIISSSSKTVIAVAPD